MIRDLVAIFGVIAGFSYYVLTVRNAQRNQQHQLETRQAQLFMQLLGQFNQPSMVESRDFYYNVELSSFDDYLSIGTEPEKRRLHRLFGGFIEGLGVLVRENYLDIKIVVGLIGGVVKALWEKQAPYVYEYRDYMKAPRAWIEWEYLYNEIVSYAEKHPELGIQDTEYSEKGE